MRQRRNHCRRSHYPDRRHRLQRPLGPAIFGYATAVCPANTLRVINTEEHFDHICGNAFFRDQGVELWGHSAIARTPAQFEVEFAEFNAAIPSAARRARGEASAFFAGTQIINPTKHISQDTQWDLGDCTVEILLTPGHTATNLSVWIPADGVLFTGDCLIREYLPNLDAGQPDDWQIWLESLDRIEALKPEIIVPGHGPVARGADVQRTIETVRRVLEESIARGYSPTGGR